MTVITAVMTRYCTVHASDSLRIERQPDGTRKLKDWQKTKIVPVQHFHGAMSYWGLDSYRYKVDKWSTLKFLQERAGQAKQFTYPEEFAQDMTDRLNKAICQMAFPERLDSGIGIHFTAYEYVEDYWIPELFLVTNYTDPSYKELAGDGVRLGRQTYHKMKLKRVPAQPEHRESEYRLAVHRHLQAGKMLVFYNGDWEMFYDAARAVFSMFSRLQKRGHLANPDSVVTYQKIGRKPIDLVCYIHGLAKEDKRWAGGRVRDLAVSPNGVYSSSSGDV